MRISPIKREDTASKLDCGKDDINNLIESAYIASIQKQGLAFNAFINEELVGQVMLTMTEVGDLDRNSFPYDRGFPGIKIEYIAVSKEWQKQGIGSTLMDYTVKYIRKYSDVLPIRFVLLEAVEDKVRWYASLGFDMLASNLRWNTYDKTTVPMFIDFMDPRLVKDYEEWYTSS